MTDRISDIRSEGDVMRLANRIISAGGMLCQPGSPLRHPGHRPPPPADQAM